MQILKSLCSDVHQIISKRMIMGMMRTILHLWCSRWWWWIWCMFIEERLWPEVDNLCINIIHLPKRLNVLKSKIGSIKRYLRRYIESHILGVLQRVSPNIEQLLKCTLCIGFSANTLHWVQNETHLNQPHMVEGGPGYRGLYLSRKPNLYLTQFLPILFFSCPPLEVQVFFLKGPK